MLPCLVPLSAITACGRHAVTEDQSGISTHWLRDQSQISIHPRTVCDAKPKLLSLNVKYVVKLSVTKEKYKITSKCSMSPLLFKWNSFIISLLIILTQWNIILWHFVHKTFYFYYCWMHIHLVASCKETNLSLYPQENTQCFSVSVVLLLIHKYTC